MPRPPIPAPSARPLAKGAFLHRDAREPLRLAPAVFLLVLAVALGAWTIANAAHPFDQPGETWRSRWGLRGFDVHLMPDGRYAANEWADVHPFDLHTGRWTETGGVIELRPDHLPGESLRLRRTRVDGCDALMPLPTRERPAPSRHDAYFLDARWCDAP